MDDYGIKVSPAGVDVLSAGEEVLTLSESNIFKIALDGTVSVSGSSTQTIAHSLGYKPHFYAFIEDESTANQMRLIHSAQLANKSLAYADATNLYIKNTHTGARDAYYYIFYDPMP